LLGSGVANVSMMAAKDRPAARRVASSCIHLASWRDTGTFRLRRPASRSSVTSSGALTHTDRTRHPATVSRSASIQSLSQAPVASTETHRCSPTARRTTVSTWSSQPSRGSGRPLDRVDRAPADRRRHATHRRAWTVPRPPTTCPRPSARRTPRPWEGAAPDQHARRPEHPTGRHGRVRSGRDLRDFPEAVAATRRSRKLRSRLIT
jgi:hypothetical protein